MIWMNVFRIRWVTRTMAFQLVMGAALVDRMMIGGYPYCKFHMHQQHYQTCLRMSIAPMQVPTYETLHCDECLWRCAQMSRALEPCLIRQVLRIDVVLRRKH